MGARINYIFKDSLTKPSVVLYSHWGETEWQRDLSMALQHAKPRWTDASYATRMMISYLTQDSIQDLEFMQSEDENFGDDYNDRFRK